MEETKDERMEYKIYQIVCNETDEVYFGKTTQTLSKRLSQHRDNHHSYTSKQIILRGDYYIEKIDSTFDEIESIILERYYIETFECVNENIPGRTSKEYREENRDIIIQKKREYYYNNRDEILKKCKIYYENNIEHKKEYDKIYYQENKDKKIIQSYLYYENKKDEISEKRKETYTCECGLILTKTNKSRHEKSKKHQNFINSK